MNETVKELRPTLKLGLPIMLGQVGQHLMPLIDTAMIGQISYEGVAAAAFGSTIVFIPMIMGFGLSLPVSVLAASGRGSGDQAEPGYVLQHGIVIQALYSLGICLLLTLGIGVGMLSWFGQEPIVVELSKVYTYYFIWSLVPTLLWVCFKNYCEAMNRPWLSLYALGISLVMNIYLNWVFIYGNLGAPRMEVAGAGLATLLARVFALVILVWFVMASKQLNPKLVLKQWIQMNAQRTKQFLGLGVPSSVQILFEIGVFVFVMIAMGWISAAAQAAHQIAIQVAATAFMVPLGLSFAAGIRVGEARGRGDFTKIRRIGLSCLWLSWAFMGIYGVGVLLLRNWLPTLFVDEVIVHQLAAQYLIVAAAFALFDGTQITTLGILRGMYDVRIPTIAIFVCYWVISAPLGVALAFGLNLEGLGLWLGLMSGLGCAAIFMTWRFLHVTKAQSELTVQ